MRKLIVAVLAVFVMVVLTAPTSSEALPVEVPQPAAVEHGVDNVRVTPLGTLLKVNRICVLLSTALPELPFWVAVLQQLAQPSVRINEPCVRAMFLLVKIVAAPGGLALAPVAPAIVVKPGATPIANVAMPGDNVLIMVPVEGDPSR